MQETSITSWEEFKNSPSKSNCYLTIIQTLKECGPLTGREICNKADQEGLWKRLSEMEKEDKVKTAGKRTCSITGRKALLWTLSEKKETVVETNNLFDFRIETKDAKDRILAA